MARTAWLPLLLVLHLAGCASAPSLEGHAARPVAGASIRFGVDTFAFANEIRSRNPDKPDLYANYCFVMARAVTQFHRFARFDPAQPRVEPAAYAQLVSEVVARGPWEDSLPADQRVVIPGYVSLHELSAAQEEAVK